MCREISIIRESQFRFRVVTLTRKVGVRRPAVAGKVGFLKEDNLKTKWSVGREGMMSGESLKMAEIELTESVILDAQMIWRPVEKQRFEVDRAIIEYETGSGMGEDYSVDFTEPRFPLTAQEERNQWDWEWQHGLSSKKDWFRKYNPDADDDMLEEMETRIEGEGTPQTEEERARESTKFDLKKAINGNGNT